MKTKLIPLLLLALTACTPRIDGLVHDKSFNKGSMVNGAMTVAGVTGVDKSIDPKQRNIYGAILTEELRDELETVRIAPVNDIVNAMSATEHNAILDEFSKNDSLSAANMNKLKASTKSRYIVLARVNRNSVKQDRTNQLPTYDTKGNEISPAKTISMSRRDMAVTLYIFDLQSGKRVWGGDIGLGRENKKTYTHESAALNIIRGVSALASGDLNAAYPFPEPPTEKSLLASIFDGFGDNLADLK
ncbi:MAG: hypothetical protein HUJ29_00920 [Gammaproteobacteria bacterium]|nr:hypothetical protein [Gammaproteobacteria bacterium]